MRSLRHPIPLERQRLNRQRFEALAPHLQTEQQVLGLAHHSCGATHSLLERCNFACTSCYLGRQANATRPLPPDEVRMQLEQLRAFLGPQGKAQLTAGEVTLLPCEVLGSYVEYARHLGLDPMVMTHGERLLEEPEYLERLVREHGLEKVAIHVDITQRGRNGWHSEVSESDLMPLRDRYASLIRGVRARTGRRFVAAHTVTVTERNLHEVPRIVEWIRKNLDAFRMISFQPAAGVGRTEDAGLRSLGLDRIWELICEGLGQQLNRHAWHFGHPECNILAPLLVLRFGADRFVALEACRPGKLWDKKFQRRLLRTFGGFGVVGRRRLTAALVAVSLAVRHLPLLLEGIFYGMYRLWGIRAVLPQVLLSLLRRQRVSLRPLAIVVHKFMNSEELATPLGRERLAACVFKVPLRGEMVSMCELNGTSLRSKENQRLRVEPRFRQA